MITKYERHLALNYLSRLVSGIDEDGRVVPKLLEWIEDNESLLDLDLPERQSSKSRRRSISGDDQPALMDQLHALQGALKRYQSSTKTPKPDQSSRNLQELGRAVGLNPRDVDILELCASYLTCPVIESLVDEVGYGRRFSAYLSVKNKLLPILLGMSRSTYLNRFRASAPLLRSGLITLDRDGDFDLTPRLERLANTPPDADLSPARMLFGAQPSTDLQWSDFEHIAEERDHVASLVKGALREKAKGVNILIYGEPGTGKTEFCRMLAKHLCIELFCIGEADEDGNEPTRSERLQDLKLAQRMFPENQNTVLLFDEMEDLLCLPVGFAVLGLRPRSSGGSKVFMHRMLEENAVPTLWTTNSAENTNLAMLRRMMYALEMRQPSRPVRARIWKRQLEQQGIEATKGLPESLAREFDATPGVAAGATAAASLVDGDGVDAVRRGVASLSRLLWGKRPPQSAPHDFDARLIQSNVDATKLAERLVTRKDQRVSLCLSGPPGTGKSAYVRHIAEQMGLELEQKRASDLMSMWVGQTEKNIARAFARAQDDGHFLVFDEADSLLADRRFAQRSWEVSQVNEMLTWMESHPLPFACTTNFVEHLDAATLRRFDFKIELDYLSFDQAVLAFDLFFGLPAPDRLRDLAALTPGDFVVVRRRGDVLDCLQDVDALLGMLREECDLKPGRAGRIGFGG